MVYGLRLMDFVQSDAEVRADGTQFNEALHAFLEAAMRAGLLHFLARHDLLPARILEAVLEVKDATLLQRH